MCQLKPHVHNGCGFDAWTILIFFPCECRIKDRIKNGKGIFSLKVINGYVQNH